jgi:hypothetical protein
MPLRELFMGESLGGLIAQKSERGSVCIIEKPGGGVTPAT